ncbi:molecular chaperone TorD family protein [Gordonibacter pamelaeae]|uniref:TorD/DmsD family molecular chaperone n=1 Tax=Gordonibacter pamelaeae TaxID=471189 RepID=UPI002FDFED4E
MTNSIDGPKGWQARAAAWELAALSFRYPGAELAGAVASGEWAAAAREIAAALGLALPEGLGEGLSGRSGPGDASAEGLRPEATRLFVGAPEPACSPYEGVWRAADDGVRALLFVNPHSMGVERFMRSCGLGRPEGTNEPLDHVATECELLEHLALRAAGAEPPEGAPADADLPGGSPAAAYGAFLEEHARAWMPRFAEAVAAESRVPFYRDAAAFLGALVG